MEENTEIVSAQVLKDLEQLEKSYAKTTYLSFTEIGQLLDKKPSVVAQYAKAGLIHPIQQGPKKLVRLDEVHLLEVYMHAAKYYGCSYVACKMLGGLLKATNTSSARYMDLIKKLEGQLLTLEEVVKHVNSFNNRGIFQKKKSEEQRKNLQQSAGND